MCQISILDIPKKIDKYIPELVSLNAYTENNLDGTGYISLKGNITKSEELPIEFFQKEAVFSSGIYHVRRASLHHNKKVVSDDLAHPFVTSKGTFVFHNGTFSTKWSIRNTVHKDVEDMRELMDTQKFCVILSRIQGNNELTTEHIKQTLEFFTGPFVLVLGNVSDPKNIYIARGKDRFLHRITFKDSEQKTVATVFNTQKLQAVLWSRFIEKVFSYNASIEPLEENSIYKYSFGTHTLDLVDKIPETVVVQNTTYYNPNTTYVYKPATPPAPKPPRVVEPVKQKESNNDSIALKLVKIARNFLGLGEIKILCYYLFGKELLEIDDTEFQLLYNEINNIKENTFGKRIQVWNNFITLNELSEDQVVDLYIYGNIRFPYTVETKARLISFLKSSTVTNLLKDK